MITPDDPSYIAFGNPLAHPLHFLGLELVFFACFALTILDVAKRYRRGETYALFQWLVILVYGIAMELLAFNAFPDYAHGQFAVELYHRKLPLYITFVYVVFDYTGLKLAERLKLGVFAEALTGGLAMLLLDVPFDIAGVDARWWTWLPSGNDVTQRWLGVPLTSYEWYLLFGAVLVWICRAVRPRVEGRSLAVRLALAPLVAVGIIVLGIIGFLPFHALEALGAPDAAIVLAHASLATLVAFRARAWKARVPPWELVAIPVFLALWHLGVIGTLWSLGGIAAGATKLGVAAAAGAALVFLFVFAREAPDRAQGKTEDEVSKLLTT